MNHSSRPEVKITVVIPTRERSDVLGKSLQTVTSQDYDALEIIVSDNCSNDRTREVVEAANDPRVRYLNTGRRLSMSHNWEFALSHVGDGWLTVIGDDDGLMPGALRRVAELISSTGTRAIRSETCYFAWPSLSAESFGRLRVPVKFGHVVRNSREWLEKVMSGSCDYPQLPMLYTGGFIDFEVMRRLRSATGSYYRSRIPDVYSAIAIASLVDTYVYSYEPLAINASSKHSIGASQFGSAKGITAAAAEKFTAETNIPLHPDVPGMPNGGVPSSLQALVYESFLQSVDLRSDGPATGHSEQLRVILASIGSAGENRIRDWGRIFARHHGLDFDAIDRRASARRRASTVRRLWSRLVNAVNTYSTNWHPGLIRDVYEASIAAAAIREISPSRLRNLARGLKWIRRKLG